VRWGNVKRVGTAPPNVYRTSVDAGGLMRETVMEGRAAHCVAEHDEGDCCCWRVCLADVALLAGGWRRSESQSITLRCVSLSGPLSVTSSTYRNPLVSVRMSASCVPSPPPSISRHSSNESARPTCVLGRPPVLELLAKSTRKPEKEASSVS